MFKAFFFEPPKYMHAAPSQQFQPLIATKIRHLNLLCFMTDGRMKNTLTNAPCNELLPGFVDADEKTLPDGMTLRCLTVLLIKYHTQLISKRNLEGYALQFPDHSTSVRLDQGVQKNLP